MVYAVLYIDISIMDTAVSTVLYIASVKRTGGPYCPAFSFLCRGNGGQTCPIYSYLMLGMVVYTFCIYLSLSLEWWSITSCI